MCRKWVFCFHQDISVEQLIIPDDKTVVDRLESTVEDNIERLRVVTGTADLKLMVWKFEQQLQTKSRLVSLINTMEEKILSLRQECIEMEEKKETVKVTIDSTSCE